MSDWVRELWMNPVPAHWHGMEPTVIWANRGPYPWEQPPCTALVKEGPKALLVLPERVDWQKDELWPSWQRWFEEGVQ